MSNQINPLVADRNRRTEWYLHDRFGMFIHWGLYAIPARGEWIRNQERITVEDYQVYFDEFNPVDYDPKQWARLAREAGMKYAVLTAKHHDGFCLFDSALTDYKSTNTQCGRDLVREFLEAFRAEGIRVGLYYSLLDWHHPDYPHCSDANHPMRGNENYPDEGRDFNRYLDYMHGQVRELLTNYGKIDLIWFDFSYGDMSCEKWRATELVNMARNLQPDILIDNRLEGSGEKGGSIHTANPSVYAGDFASPEQMIPPAGVTDDQGNSIPWESCVTLNDHWGYHAHDHNYKTSRMIIHNLVECVSKNGNLLLNVGPDAKGNIPAESVTILKDVGRWMRANSASIYGCGIASGHNKPEWGRYTQNGKKLYAHVMEEGISAICLEDMADKVEKIRLLADGSELKISTYWNTKEYPQHLFFFLQPDAFRSHPLPDPMDTVVEVTLK